MAKNKPKTDVNTVFRPSIYGTYTGPGARAGAYHRGEAAAGEAWRALGGTKGGGGKGGGK